jgi:hypothetical protein
MCVCCMGCVCVPCGAARKGLGIIAASLSSLTLCPPHPTPRTLVERSRYKLVDVHACACRCAAYLPVRLSVGEGSTGSVRVCMCVRESV